MLSYERILVVTAYDRTHACSYSCGTTGAGLMNRVCRAGHC